jgi:GNAT superfamily N-acetyltransferase
MSIRYVHQSTDVLSDYGDVSSAFTVRSTFQVEAIERGLGGWRLTEGPVDPPYVKDYDLDKDEGPTRWLRWDTSNWRVILALDGSDRVGGAVVAWNTPGSHFLEGRDDIAALWDIRVQPDRRGRGIGSGMFEEAVSYARSRGCRQL